MALEELRRVDREAVWSSRLIGALSQRLRSILAREIGTGEPREVPEGLADELALAVYFTLAADGPGRGAPPRLLASLNRGLSQALGSLAPAGRTDPTHGGGDMYRKTIIAAAVCALFVAVPAAQATPEFAKQWQASCSSCHVGAPTELDEEGIAFKLAGYDMDVEPKIRHPKLFLSLLTDLATYDTASDDMERPDSASLYTLLRLDKKNRVKIFAIGELTDEDEGGLNLDFAHGHVQINPWTEEPEKLNLRIGNVEPTTRLWNTDMRRPFETALWGGVSTGSGLLEHAGGGHHAHGGGGAPAILPGSDWGADLSAVLNRGLLVAGGVAGDYAYGGVFVKRGGRGFDNSTVPEDFDYGALSEKEREAFNRKQINLAKKWERSVIFGLSAYAGNGSQDVFDGSFLAAVEADHDPHAMEDDEHGEAGDDHGAEGDDDHGDDDHGDDDHGDDDHGDDMGHMDDDHAVDDDHADFFPTRVVSSTRLVGEVKARWDRYSFYAVGVYGENDYALGDPLAWDEAGLFARTGGESRSFLAWALEASARFKVSRQLSGRAALRYEQLAPEADAAARFERVVANVTVPIRMMRPALWPYLELSQNFFDDQLEGRVGLRLGF
ncbi:MAG: hypothetical protein D6696_02100 [Acidobacteria bacterium]|nr:MAG: hypothetical protein D6696_02100 [Acidobacteriota bacterium]